MIEAGSSFHIITLGCKINQYESRLLKEVCLSQGAIECPDPAAAELVIINSCAVTAEAVADLRGLCRRLHRQNEHIPIVLTGCAAQAVPSQLATLPSVRLILSQAGKFELVRSGRMDFCKPDPTVSSYRPFGPEIAIKGYDRSRPVLKIQDGCSHRCSYCIVPLARGPARSRPSAEILSEAEGLYAAGYGELVISGINLACFGRDLEPAMDFWDLLAMLDRELGRRWAGRRRLRISSLDPAQLNDKALAVLRDCVMLCPHLHLSLQSASPVVLRNMGRGHCRIAELSRMIERLDAVWPLFSLGADLLVGFPGESENDFKCTLNFYDQMPFTYAHVFPYSKRPGTPAALMAGQIEAREKKSRAEDLRALAIAKKRAFLKRLSGLETVEAVMATDALETGMTQYYMSCRLAEPLKTAPPFPLLKARPHGVKEDSLLVSAFI